ncbi:MAG: insulinase family protein [Rubellimicrobium sp.]|nr:insulinase family protein [Rubellimicrobium sp.]
MTIELHTLPNGLRIATEPMDGLQSAAVGIWVTAGGRNETREENGIAHFLEHMAFKGTTTRSALQIAEAIEDVGGYINAYTSRETTAYYARVLKDDVGLALDILADILINPTFAAEEIEVERGVILQEIGQALDTPDDVVFDWLQEVAYPDQALGRTILGPEERVSQFDAADLRRFTATHYGPGQMILCATGAVDHDDICRQAESLFGHLPALAHPPAPEPARWQGGERHVVKTLEQVHFALALEGPDYRDPLIHTAQVWGVAMGGGMSSRLFQEIREKRGLCYTIFAQAGAYADTGLTTIYAGTGADDITDLARLTMAEIARSAADMTEAEVARARAQMKAGMLMGLESPTQRAERLARALSIWGRVPPIEELVAKIDAVGVDDVRAFGARMAGGTGMALTVYGPTDSAPRLDELRERLVA